MPTAETSNNPYTGQKDLAAPRRFEQVYEEGDRKVQGLPKGLTGRGYLKGWPLGTVGACLHGRCTQYGVQWSTVQWSKGCSMRNSAGIIRGTALGHIAGAERGTTALCMRGSMQQCAHHGTRHRQAAFQIKFKKIAQSHAAADGLPERLVPPE